MDILKLKELKEKVKVFFTGLLKMGMKREQASEMLRAMVSHSVIAIQARDAYDAGVPVDQGPVWFGDDAWKTDFWVRQWEWQKAYREGEDTRARFGSCYENPYYQEKPPFNTRLLELGYLWGMGFSGKVLL